MEISLMIVRLVSTVEMLLIHTTLYMIFLKNILKRRMMNYWMS